MLCGNGTEVNAMTGSLGDPAAPVQTRRPSRPCRTALRDVCRQQVRLPIAPIRHPCERLRTPAADIGSLARANLLYPEPQDCSDDSAAGHYARLMHYPLPTRFRGLPVERPVRAPGPPGEFDALRPDTANHPGPPSPRPAGCASASGASAGALRAANRAFNSFPVRLSPLTARALGEAARQLPAHRRISTA